MVFWPFLSVIILLAIHGKMASDCKPVWGDEQWWCLQASAVAEYGKPLGYWGYNGGTAPIGTFAAWGPAAVLPFGLFGKIFGWNYYSYVYANIFYMCAANFIFLLLTKAGRKEVTCLCMVNFCMVVRSCFAVTAMMECVRGSFGIIAVALLISMDLQESFFVKYIVTPILLFYFTQAYLMMGVFFFFYFYIVLKKADFKWQQKVLSSFVCMAIAVFFSKWILNFFTSPYIKNSNLTFTEKIFNNIKWLFDLFGNENPFFYMYFLGYLVLMFSILVFMLVKRKEQKELDRKLYAAAFIILAVFLAAHIIFYNTTAWTLVRGLSIALVISLFLLCLAKSKAAVFVFLVFSFFTLPMYHRIESTFFHESRFCSDVWNDAVAEYSKIFEQILEVKEDADTPWENTISTYFMQGSDVFGFVLPNGYALNSMIDQTVNKKAKYAMMGKWNDFAAYSSKFEELLSAGFVEVFDDDKITVLRNMNYD